MVIIAGGSWAVGEWQSHKLAGPGLAHYFSSNDHATINLSRSSIGNIQQIQLVQELLSRFRPAEDDRFYWLVHSPLVDVAVEQIYQDQISLAHGIDKLLHEQLQFADQIAKKHNIKINLIGASCDLDSIQKFDHLHMAVSSWGRLLDDSYPASIFGHQTDHMTELKQAIQQHRPDLLKEYYQIGGMAFSKRRTMTRRKDMFQCFHPTSLAHEILSKQLANSFY